LEFEGKQRFPYYKKGSKLWENIHYSVFTNKNPSPKYTQAIIVKEGVYGIFGE
jgi:hypothetical protein